MAHLSFQAIRRQHGITISQLADVAGVAPREAYLFEIGVCMEQQCAETLVRALTLLTGEPYTLADFRAPMSEQPTIPLPTIPLRRLSCATRSRSM
jgi:transcriptional regulator with XRE-family HTH domain